MSKKEGRIYMCDPEKNTECEKTSCYINGGACRRTRHPEFAKEEPEEHMNDHWDKWAEEMTGCNGDSCPIIFEEDEDGSKETKKAESH